MAEQTFDVVILGGGSGGYACALRAAQLGLSVALIEKDKLGGTCLHRGCVPTKALLHAAEVADTARESSHYGVFTELQGIDINKVNEYRDGVIGRLYKGLQGLVKSKAITYVEGTGRLTAANTVEVNGEKYVGKNIVLGTGSYARSLPGLEIGGAELGTRFKNRGYEGRFELLHEKVGPLEGALGFQATRSDFEAIDEEINAYLIDHNCFDIVERA